MFDGGVSVAGVGTGALPMYDAWQNGAALQAFSPRPLHGSLHGCHDPTLSWSAQPDSGVHCPVDGSIANQVSLHDNAAQRAATHASPLPHSLVVSQGFPAQPARRISNGSKRFIGASVGQLPCAAPVPAASARPP
jgi:hypothetical protein